MEVVKQIHEDVTVFKKKDGTLFFVRDPSFEAKEAQKLFDIYKRSLEGEKQKSERKECNFDINWDKIYKECFDEVEKYYKGFGCNKVKKGNWHRLPNGKYVNLDLATDIQVEDCQLRFYWCFEFTDSDDEYAYTTYVFSSSKEAQEYLDNLMQDRI